MIRLGCALLALAGCGPRGVPAAAPDGGLIWEQLRLRGPVIGEAALVVGPDGTSVLIDVGNDSHEDAIREALAHHTGEEAVDWVVLTHAHADHVGGFDKLFDPAGARPVPVRRGVVVRGGPVGGGANARERAEVDAILADPSFGAPVFALCDAAACPGLWRGALDTPGDEGPTRIPLGDGADLWLLLSNGAIATADGVIPGPPLGVDDSEDENARSLGGALRWGDFSLLFAGDLTGGGKDTPDVETAIAAVAADPWPDRVDVLKLSHHGIRSSTNDAWIARFLHGGPAHALVGANSGYLAAPSSDVLDALAPALDGGRVWASGTGSLVRSHPALVDAGRAVVVSVDGGGADIRVLLREGQGYVE